MSALVQFINYQLCNLLLSLKPKSHTLQSNSHFIPELSICALGALTMHNLTYTAHLLECQRPTLFGQYAYFFYLFIFRLVFKAIALHPVILWVLHVAPHFRN